MTYNSWVPNPVKKKKRKHVQINMNFENINKDIDNENIRDFFRDLSINVDYKISTTIIYFIITIKNVGNQTLKNIYISNNYIYHLFINDKLDIGKEVSTIFTYYVTIDDFNRGYIECVTMGFSVDEKIIHSNIHEITIDVLQFPKLSLYHYIFNSEIVYHIKNCGNVTLSNIILYSIIYGDIYVNNEMEPMEEIILTGTSQNPCLDQACVVGIFNGYDIYSNKTQ